MDLPINANVTYGNGDSCKPVPKIIINNFTPPYSEVLMQIYVHLPCTLN